eukprot:SAG31_NODE_407_length_16049_cov_46.312915_15_plen_58_part_00
MPPVCTTRFFTQGMAPTRPAPTAGVLTELCGMVRSYFLVFVPTIREIRYFYGKVHPC